MQFNKVEIRFKISNTSQNKILFFQNHMLLESHCDHAKLFVANILIDVIQH